MAKLLSSRPMSSKKFEKVADPKMLTPAIPVGQHLKVAYPLETRMNKGFKKETGNDCDKSLAYPPRPMIPESITPLKAAELTGWGLTTIKRHCRDGKFKGVEKTLIGGNESWQIPVASLPPEAQAKYWAEVKADVVARAVVIAPLSPALQERSPALTGESVSMIEAYERSPRGNKEKAEKAVAVVRMRNDLVRQGFSIGEAEKAVSAALGASRASINRYHAATKGHPESELHARLAPQYGSGRPPVAFTEEAYQFILGLWLSPSEPPLSALLVTARDMAPSRRWVIPSDDAVRARINKEPRQLVIAGRKGLKALEQSQPPARRNYNVLVNDTWCSDGHRLDFFVQGADGKPYRPFLIAWCDIRSRAVLGVIVCRDPDAQSVLRAFGMAMRRTGTAPRRAVLDNGMEYAAKSVTGGQANRYRYKVKFGDTPGVLTQVGTVVDWAPPARGQEKPIESYWNFIILNVAKAPEFEGAYCGKDTASKPEGFDAKKYAVPYAIAEAKLEWAFNYFNTRHEHRGQGMNQRTPEQVYYDPACNETFRPIDPMYIDMCNQGVAQIKPDRSTVYTVTIPGHGSFRYWSEKIHGLPSRALDHKHEIYYDLDDPQKPIWVMDRGALIDRAACIRDIPFREEEGGTLAMNHKKGKNARMKPTKDAVKELKINAANTLLGLPAAPIDGMFTPIPVTIEAKRSSLMLPAPEVANDWEETGIPGEFRDKETGTVYREKRITATAAPVIQTTPITDDEEQQERELAELERQVREKKRLLITQTY